MVRRYSDPTPSSCETPFRKITDFRACVDWGSTADQKTRATARQRIRMILAQGTPDWSRPGGELQGRLIGSALRSFEIMFVENDRAKCQLPLAEEEQKAVRRGREEMLGHGGRTELLNRGGNGGSDSVGMLS